MQDYTIPTAPPVQQLLDLSGQTAIVTGASGGIGNAIARRLAEAGAKVVVHYHQNAASAAQLVQTIEAAGGTAQALQADLRTADGCADLLQQAHSALGCPNILVNNAGIQSVAELLTMDETALQDMLSANINAPVLLTQHFATLVKRHAETVEQANQNSSYSITNIASIEGLQPAAGHSHYASSKAALLMFTRAAALELGKLGIRVNAIAPGLIEREGLAQDWPEGVSSYRRAAPLGEIGRNSDIADAVLFLSSPAARWITGSNLVVDGGVSCAPSW